jgi:hypothetical protein
MNWSYVGTAMSTVVDHPVSFANATLHSRPAPIEALNRTEHRSVGGRVQVLLLFLIESDSASHILLRRGQDSDFQGGSRLSSSRTPDHSCKTDSLSAWRDRSSESCQTGGPWLSRSLASERHRRSIKATRCPVLKLEMSMLSTVTHRSSSIHRKRSMAGIE